MTQEQLKKVPMDYIPAVATIDAIITALYGDNKCDKEIELLTNLVRLIDGFYDDEIDSYAIIRSYNNQDLVFDYARLSSDCKDFKYGPSAIVLRVSHNHYIGIDELGNELSDATCKTIHEYHYD